VQYKPVDCDTGADLPFTPPYIDKSAIYTNGTKPGWGWWA
jgi:hypothetical protein